MNDIVLAMTGASGAVYGVRLLEVLLAAGKTVHLTISPAASQVIRHELGLKVDLAKFDPAQILPDGKPEDSTIEAIARAGSDYAASSIFADSTLGTTAAIHYHHYQNFMAGIASGSFLTAGMVICPCSMGTLAAIATGQSNNVIHRAAEVHLKERRPLIVVPRETPLSPIALGNMQRLAELGVIVLPAMPGFYHAPTSIQDMIDFIVGRICDQLRVRHNLCQRWGS